MQDYYALLEVAETAAPARIERAHALARQRLIDDTALTDAKRNARIASLDLALTTLCDPKRREIYDRELESWRTYQAAGGKMIYVRRVLLVGALITAVGVAGGWWWQQRETRAALEAESRAAEAAMQARLAKSAAERERSAEILARETEKREAEEAVRLEALRVERANEMKDQRFVSDDARERQQRDRSTELARKQARFEELRRRLAEAAASPSVNVSAEVRQQRINDRLEFEQLKLELARLRDAEAVREGERLRARGVVR